MSRAGGPGTGRKEISLSRFIAGRLRRTVLAATLGLAAMLSLVLSSGAATASNLSRRPGAAAASGATARPAAATTPGFNAFSNTMQSAGLFCDNPADAPCDGNAGAGDYGTADIVPATFSNGGFGDYAAGGAAPSPTGLAKYAVISGTTAANQGLGCQTPGTEGCTGPYIEDHTRPQTGFPSNGYTVTVYQYVDPSYSSVKGDAQFDTDLGIDTSGGGYGRDEVITTCLGGGAASLSFSNGSPGTCSGAGQITTAGWYHYVWLATNVGGKVFVTARVLDSSNSVVFDSGPQALEFGSDTTPEPVSAVGGLRYLWWSTLNVSGLPVGFVGYKAGQLQNGQAA
jgi:hypothetical protein